MLLAAAAGFVFAAFSTHDFINHLDRQVHSLHCSFIPGLAAADATGSSGCHVTMMSPYSSFLRSTVWGGVPVSLPAMAVFAFLFFWALKLWFGGQQRDQGRTGFLFLATLLPFLTSVVMGIISFATLGAACKLCIGIYASSIVCTVAAWLLWKGAAGSPADGRMAAVSHETELGNDPPFPGSEPTRPFVRSVPSDFSFGQSFFSFLLGVAFVGVAVAAYLAALPDYSQYTQGCGELSKGEDIYDVMVPLGSQLGVETIEVVDPLCPACSAFEQRLEASGLSEKLSRKALLFPLDSTCNWMVGEAVHPGACIISEAVMCADEQADTVLAWAFEHQSEIRELSANNPKAAERAVLAAFPRLKRCIGSPKVKAKLNKSLRWVVNNHLPVLTPQLYVGGKKLCDEDIDLGLSYTLSRMLDKQQKGAF
ncbi:MAG: hypothetical protein IPJ88_08730 [Myxococcales bacterium]|nr:MAG: hypothetical protein IPJ88_08730 [Myxococcales bacterium]